jgi:hypothetical protein
MKYERVNGTMLWARDNGGNRSNSCTNGSHHDNELSHQDRIQVAGDQIRLNPRDESRSQRKL